MSIVDVTEMWSKKGGSVSSELRNPFDQTFAFTRGFQVLSDTIGESEVAVALAPGIPVSGDPHPSGVAAFVTSKRVVAVGPVFWMVEVGYEGETLDPPTVEVEWTDVSTTEPIDRDWNGAAIVTANGEQVDGLSVDISDQVVIIKRRFATINTYAIRQYRRSTNSDTFLGWPPGTARLMSFQAKNKFTFGAPQEAWDVTARIQFREPLANTSAAEAWYKRWRHEGLLIRQGGIIRRATDEFKQEVTKPVLLTATGEQETDPDAAVFIHSQVYGSLPYSALGLL
jgi:hypothetical protein